MEQRAAFGVDGQVMQARRSVVLVLVRVSELVSCPLWLSDEASFRLTW
jgi:hypothetical protein